MSTPSSTPTTPPPPALRLITDLWLDILDAPDVNLNFGDLKRFSRSPKLDKRLFRSPPPATRLEPGNTVAFHPALDRTNLVCTSLSDAYVFVPKPVTDYSCVNDYATSPACTTLSLMMGSNPIVRKPLKVTVLDVIKRCVKMWASKPPLERALQVVEWDVEARVEEVTWRDTLGDHCFWEGMESAKVAKQDWVRLYPKWFGS